MYWRFFGGRLIIIITFLSIICFEKRFFFFFLPHLVLCLVTQLYLTFCNPMDCCLPGSPVHRILQARILKGVAMPSPRGSSRDWKHISCIAGGFFTVWATREALRSQSLCRISVPWSGIEPMPQQWKCQVLTMELSGNSWKERFNLQIAIEFYQLLFSHLLRFLPIIHKMGNIMTIVDC